MDIPGSELGERVSRRRLLAALAGAGATGVAGCLDGEPGSGTPTATSASPPTSAATTRPDDGDGGETSTERPSKPTTLTGDGSSSVYPVTSRAASVWNSNPPPRDRKAWGPGQYGIRTDQHVADYWAGLYGFTRERSTQPPFLVNVGLSDSETGLDKAMEGAVDVGDASAPAEDELADADAADLGGFTDHVIGVDAQPVVVSREVYDAGVTRLTADQVKRIFTGEIARWSELPSYSGPDREIRVVGRAAGSGTDTAFRANLFGDPEASLPGLDVREAQNQQVRATVERSNDAIAYLALAFVAPKGPVPPVALEFDGTLYEYGRNLDAPGYPLRRDLHVYTYGGISKPAAAFLRMLLSEYGQQRFVASSGYLPLPPGRRRAERAKLPDATAGGPAETASETETASDETTST